MHFLRRMPRGIQPCVSPGRCDRRQTTAEQNGSLTGEAGARAQLIRLSLLICKMDVMD